MKKPKANYPERSRLSTALPADLRRRLDVHCASAGIYQRAAIERSVRQFLDGTSDMTLLYRRLDASSRQIRRLSQQVELQGQFLCEFVQLWLHNTPPLPQPDQQAIRRQAQAAYQRLLERTAVNVSGGKTFIDELPKEVLSPESAGSAEEPPAEGQILS